MQPHAAVKRPARQDGDQTNVPVPQKPSVLKQQQWINTLAELGQILVAKSKGCLDPC